MKNSKVLRSAILSMLLTFTFCTFSMAQKVKRAFKLNKAQVVATPLPKDDCCDLKYPARQAEVAGLDLLTKQFVINSFRPNPSANFKYKLTHSPSANYQSISQAYINYAKALYPCATHTGSKFKISQGNFSGGHTSRHMVRPNYVSFYPSPGGMVVNDPIDFWNNYYSIPTNFPPLGGYTGNLSTTNGLEYNTIYSLEYGFWVAGCSNLTQKEQDCLGYHHWVNFRLQASTGPLRSATGPTTVVLELLNEKGRVIEKRKIAVNKDGMR